MTLQEQIKKARLDLDRAVDLQRAKESNTKDTRYGKFNPNSTEGKKALAELTKASEAVNKAKTYYDNLQAAFAKEQEKKAITGEEEGTPEAVAAARAGQTIEEYRASKQEALDKDQAARDAANTDAAAQQDVATYGQFLNTIASDEVQLRAVQADLKKNFPTYYTGGTSGLKDWRATQAALEAIYTERGRLPKVLQGTDLRTFLIKPTEGFAKGGTTGDAGGIYRTISDPTQAASLIKSAFKSVIGREPTVDEVNKFTKELNKAEKANPSKVVNGTTTGGIDRIEFLTQQIQKLPEFGQKKQEKANLVSNSIQTVARANGLNLGADQLKEWTTAIENGTDPETIKSKIRNIAGYGLPDNVKKMLADGVDLVTIYNPYISTMASTLEVNPETINLSDPTLRNAIGPDKEMSIYDFQKVLRKDPRWQYTNNAREDVFQSVNKVLQDFGFQG